MIIFLFPLLLHFTSADILSDHLTNNVDVDVNPCDDFYRHVCSQSINNTDFPFWKISKFYRDIADKYRDTKNSSILNDIALLNATTLGNKPYFNASVFENLLRERCDDNDTCYQNEFAFYHTIFELENKMPNNRSNDFADNLNKTSGNEIMEYLPVFLDYFYKQFNATKVVKVVHNFYLNLINRVELMEELRARGILEEAVKIDDDQKHLKALITGKLRKTPWLNEKDDFGVTLLPEFENKIDDINIYFDLSYNSRERARLEGLESKFITTYGESRKRSTGVEMSDIYLSLHAAFEACFVTDVEGTVLILRVINRLSHDRSAFYYRKINKIAMLASYHHPALTNNITLNKHYNLYSVVGHEIYHSIILKKWANISNTFKSQMECFNGHFNRTCDSFGVGSCNSGAQTFTEDGADVEGFRTSYEFFSESYGAEDLKEIVYSSNLLSVTREQAFFYLWGITWCSTLSENVNHTDVHSPLQIRVNGVMEQMPEFTKAFSCSPDQRLYTTKEQTCHLFGPDST